ncbi:MAG: tellurite resistance TerB family protein [Micropepsaceae bacterium]
MAIDGKKLLDQFLNSGVATGVVAGMLGGALARRTGLGGIARIGGVALVGTLAYQAWQRYQQQQGALGPDQRSIGGIRDTIGGVLKNMPGVGDLLQSGQHDPQAAAAGFGSDTLSQSSQNQLGTGVLVAMIAAAKADGEVDQTESQKIFGQMEQAGLSSEEKAFLLGQLAKPLNLEDVAKLATTPEVGAQLYTASALVIDQASEKERNYLGMLAQRLNLPQGFVDQLQQQIGK